LKNMNRSARRGSPKSLLGNSIVLVVSLAVGLLLPVSNALAQEAAPAGTVKSEVKLMQMAEPGQGVAPIAVTLKDALERARKNDPMFLGAVSDAKSAHEDRLQSRNSMLPQITATSQYLGTQGNDVTPNGRFVTNDGIHVYRDWGVLRQDLSPALLMGTAYSKAKAGEALANAKAEIARRGLAVTVTKNFFIGERRSLEFRTSVFNLFNSANPKKPEVTGLLFNFDGTVSSGLGDPRQAQLGVKLIF